MEKLIKNMKISLQQNKDNKDNNNIDETVLRVKKNLFDAMIKKYQHVMERFHNQENEIKNIKENKLIRTVEIVLTQNLNEKQKKEVIENPEMVQQMYANKLKGIAHDNLKYAVKDLEERHKDILILKNSIFQLHKMIVELNLLVQYQGEMIDNIVDNVSKAKDYVEKGEIQINKAHGKMKKPFYKFW